MLEEYLTVGGIGQDMVVIKRSKFIGAAAPAAEEAEALAFIEKVREEHRQATHNVYAYQVGENNQLQRFSDDGEPSGTAGMPVLEVIKQMDLRNVVVVVTRYFGGTLLGAGGLVRAYTEGAKIGILAAGIVKMMLHTRFEISVDYTFAGKLQNVVIQSPWRLDDIEYGAKVCFKVLAPPGEETRVREVFTEVTGGQAVIQELGREYVAIPVEKG
ncbi:MAG: YigZ family protein [Firmicutes bacterium]|nr:YigZ family protein [Bacillota bacterium]